MRTLLIMLGPIIGVAAMVERRRPDRKRQGRPPSAARPARDQPDHRPGRRHLRIPESDLARRRRRAGRERLDGDQRGGHDQPLRRHRRCPTQGASTYYEAFPVPVRAADLNLPVGARGPDAQRALAELGRHPAPHCARSSSARGSPSSTATCPGETRTIRLNNTNFGVVGVLGSVPLDPDLDNAAFVTQWAAKHVFGTNGQPNQLYVRTRNRHHPGHGQRASPRPSTSAGPTRSPTQIPSDVLQAAAQANKTLQQVALLAGLLGPHRRRDRHRQRHVDLGHPALVRDRHPPGRRPQPLQDRRPVPPRVALRRASSAGSSAPSRDRASSTGVSAVAGWVVVIDYGQIPIWMGLALLVSIIAGLYPSIKAARLEPLETLRLG